MKVKFMNFKEMAITQNTGMCSYLTIAWAVAYFICLNPPKAYSMALRRLPISTHRKTFREWVQIPQLIFR